MSAIARGGRFIGGGLIFFLIRGTCPTNFMCILFFLRIIFTDDLSFFF